jgi:hypothetical protein
MPFPPHHPASAPIPTPNHPRYQGLAWRISRCSPRGGLPARTPVDENPSDDSHRAGNPESVSGKPKSFSRWQSGVLFLAMSAILLQFAIQYQTLQLLKAQSETSNEVLLRMQMMDHGMDAFVPESYTDEGGGHFFAPEIHEFQEMEPDPSVVDLQI